MKNPFKLPERNQDIQSINDLTDLVEKLIGKDDDLAMRIALVLSVKARELSEKLQTIKSNSNG